MYVRAEFLKCINENRGRMPSQFQIKSNTRWQMKTLCHLKKLGEQERKPNNLSERLYDVIGKAEK